MALTKLPLHRDETFYQGATWRRHYRWLSGGVPVDLSTWAGRMLVRPRGCSASPVLTLTEAEGGVTLSANGDIELLATDEQTALIFGPGDYVMELVQPGNGDVVRFVMGKAQFSR
jgi:hypothetical protein